METVDTQATVHEGRRDEALPPPAVLRRRYVLEERLGAGGLGVVHAAFDRDLQRRVAIKLVQATASAHRDADHHQARILREAQALAQLSHPNVVAVYDVGVYDRGGSDPGVYLVMELIDGQTLSAWLRGSRSLEELLHVFMQAGRGLAAAHEVGLVHRDFKPTNVMIDAGGGVKVVDFGLAYAVDAKSMPTAATSIASVDDSQSLEPSRLTQTGLVTGTPAYMAPEQFTGRQIGPAADQYAFCQSFLAAVQGREVFEGKDFKALAAAKTKGKRLPAPTRDRTPAWLRRVLERGLEVDPSKRWPSMSDLLDRIARGSARGRTRRATWLLGSVAALGVTGVLAAPVHDACQSPAWTWDAAGLDGATARPLHELRAQWDRAWQQTCEAQRDGTLEADVADRRFACLDRRRAELDGIATVMAGLEPEADEARDSIVENLPSVQECTDDAALASDMPPPESAIAEAVAEVRTMMSRIDAQFRAGRREEAWALQDEAYRLAEELGYGPLRAEAVWQRGVLALQEARNDEAEEHLAQALRIAEEVGHAKMAAEAAAALVFVRGVRQHEFEAALALYPTAEAWVARAGRPPRVHARLLIAVGAVYNDLHRFDEAIEAFDRAIEVQRSVDEPDEMAISITLGNKASALQGKGELKQAEALQREILALRRRVLGEGHPDLAAPLLNLGNTLGKQGRLEESEALLQQAVELVEATSGPDAPPLASILIGLGVAQKQQGHYDEGARSYARAREIARATWGEEHDLVATATRNLANLEKRGGNLDRARELSLEAIDLLERRLGNEHPELGNALTDLGSIHRVRGEYDQARRRYARALEIFEAAGPDRSIDVAWIHSHLGTLELDLGDPEAAEQRYRLALELGRDGQPEHVRAYAQAGLGRALQALGRHDEAIAELQAAIEVFERTGPQATAIGLARGTLAEAQWAIGQREQAVASAEQALTELTDPLDAADRAELEQWLRARR